MEAVIGYIVNEVVFDNNSSLIESLYNGFHESILKGILEKGDRINLSHYAERLNVSRTPIRQALLKIEKEGLIRRDPQAGFIVVYSSSNYDDDIFRMIEIKKQFYFTCLNFQYNSWESSKKEILSGILESMKKSIKTLNQIKLKKEYQHFFNELIGIRVNRSEGEILRVIMMNTNECEDVMISFETYRNEMIEHLDQIVKHFDNDHIMRFHLSSIFNLMKAIYENEFMNRGTLCNGTALNSSRIQNL